MLIGIVLFGVLALLVAVRVFALIGRDGVVHYHHIRGVRRPNVYEPVSRRDPRRTASQKARKQLESMY